MSDDPRLVALAAEVSRDPEYLRMMDRMRRIGDLRRGPALTPRDVRGEQLAVSLALGMSAFKFSPVGPLAEGLLRRTPEGDLRWIFAEGTRRATPYLWTREMALLAKSMPLPRHVLGEDLFPHDVMYWTLDRELRLVNAPAPYVDVTINGWLVVRTSVAYLFAAFMEFDHEGGRGAGLAVEMVPIGSRYPDDFAGGLADDALRFAAFLNSPFINVAKHKVESVKKQRRRYGPRIGDPVALNVVTLRAEVREAVQVERGDGPQWKQRWIVRGHYRAQWYPATKTHRVIWIAPYIKGPDDAPLKQPVYAVSR